MWYWIAGMIFTHVVFGAICFVTGLIVSGGGKRTSLSGLLR